MALKEKIQSDIIVAMKSKEVLRRETLKYIKAQIQVAEMEKNAKDVDDAKVVKIMEKAIESMKLVGNTESLAQIAILEEYIPSKMSVEEIEKEVNEIVASGANNIGLIMGLFTKKHSGKADNKLVMEAIKKALV